MADDIKQLRGLFLRGKLLGIGVALASFAVICVVAFFVTWLFDPASAALAALIAGAASSFFICWPLVHIVMKRAIDAEVPEFAHTIISERPTAMGYQVEFQTFEDQALDHLVRRYVGVHRTADSGRMWMMIGAALVVGAGLFTLYLWMTSGGSSAN